MLTLFYWACCLLPAVVLGTPPEALMTTPELIRAHGFPCETHYVETPDNFVLALHRIPSTSGISRGTIVMQHGLLADSSDWVLNEAFNSYGFVAADLNYDVWLLNSRGNRYSTNNTVLKPSQKEFWDWSWDEMAKYDVPSSIEYIRSLNPSSKLAYFAGSQGTTLLWSHLSADPSFAAGRIDLFVAFGPVAYVFHTQDTLLRDASKLHIGALLAELGYYDFLPSKAVERDWLTNVCKHIPALCTIVADELAGIESSDLNQTRLPVYFGHFPSGTSVRDVEHFAQEIRTNAFQMFDFGSHAANRAHYGPSHPTPPAYNLSQFPINSLPTALFSGGKDKLADPSDVAQLLEDLLGPPVLHVFEPDFGHLDWTWGSNNYQTVYPKVFALVEKYVAAR